MVRANTLGGVRITLRSTIRISAACLAAFTLASCSTPEPRSVDFAPPSSLSGAPNPPAVLPREACDAAPDYSGAAAYNNTAADGLLVAPFGRNEMGWRTYEPLAAATLATGCAVGSQGFARALAMFQAQHGLPASGAFTVDTLQSFKGVWQEQRPFVMLRLANVCPPPREAELETLTEAESYGGKTVQLRRGAAAAYRRMVAAARREDGAIAADPQLLVVFSGYRSPEYDAARCAAENNCQGLVRAACSAHRTGLAMDVDVGSEPGFAVDSSVDSNRLAQTQGPAYRWLVRNAGRFGFVNYAFEPWHWEWTGEAP